MQHIFVRTWRGQRARVFYHLLVQTNMASDRQMLNKDSTEKKAEKRTGKKTKKTKPRRKEKRREQRRAQKTVQGRKQRRE